MKHQIERVILTSLVFGAILTTTFIFCFRVGYQRGTVIGAAVVNRSWELASTNAVPSQEQFATHNSR